MSGFWSLEVPFWPKRNKRQKPDKATGTAVAASEEQAVEASVPVAQEAAAESKKPADAPAAVAQEPAPEPQQSAETPRAEPQKQERPQDAAQGASPGTRRLWGREFAIVNGGLSPDQVVSFVESVRVEYDKRLQEKGGSNTWDSFSKQVLAEAEREAARIRLKAQQEAEVEAARLISEGKRRAQEETEKASRRAQEITEKGVQDILAAANKKAQIAESRARQLSQLMLIRAREDIQDHITGEVQRAYHRLNGMLEDMMGSAKGIEAEWRDKTLELWSSPALVEAMDETLLLGEGQIEALEATSPPVVLEEDLATAQQTPQERMTEPIERVEEQVVGTQEVTVESTPSVDTGVPPAPEMIEQHTPEDIVIGEVATPPRPEEPPLAPTLEEVARESIVIGEAATPPRPEEPPLAPTLEEVARESIVIGEAATPPRPEEPPLAPTLEEVTQDIVIGEVATPPQPEAQATVSSMTEEPLLSPEGPLVAPIIEEIATPVVDGETPLAPDSHEEPEQYIPSAADVPITVLGEETAAEKAEPSARENDERSSPGLGEVLTPKTDTETSGEEGKFDDLYNGEVDLILSPPVDFGRVSELYSHLQTLPEVRVLHTAGSWEQGTVVTVIIDKAGPLIGPLKTLPTIDAKPLLTPTSSGLLKSAMGSLGEKGRRRQRISIAFKESEAPQLDGDATPEQETSS